jgi:uncharacterized delta-60 repeat protein
MKTSAYLFIIYFQLFAMTVSGQTGYRDQSFGNGGVSSGLFPGQDSYGYAVLQQSSNGKIIVAGSREVGAMSEFMFVVRYLSDGTLDTSFGTTGFLVDSMSSVNIASAWGLAEQADGKILVTGWMDYPSYDNFIIRFDSSGHVDQSFGYNGRVIFDNNGNEDQSFCIKVQADGKIVICGTTTDTITYNQNLLVVRFNSDGSRDSTFGVNGIVSDDFNTDDDAGVSMVIQPDGKILVAGLTTTSSSFLDAVIVRYLPGGSRDNSFNGNGYFTFDLSGDDDGFRDIALQQDGKIIAAGASWDLNGYENGLLARLDSNGILDTSFGSAGIVLESYPFDDVEYVSVLVRPDGKIVTAGFTGVTQYDLTLSRYLNNGSLDVTFANAGRITDSLTPDDDEIYDAILQNDNKIVVVGNISLNGQYDCFVARYENDTLINTVDLPQDQNYIFVFPQPAGERLNIRTAENIMMCEIVDSQGRVMIRTNNKESIDLSTLTSGVYFLRLTGENNCIHVVKFVRE